MQRKVAASRVGEKQGTVIELQNNIDPVTGFISPIYRVNNGIIEAPSNQHRNVVARQVKTIGTKPTAPPVIGTHPDLLLFPVVYK